jgi:hypothetical protein
MVERGLRKIEINRIEGTSMHTRGGIGLPGWRKIQAACDCTETRRELYGKSVLRSHFADSNFAHREYMSSSDWQEVVAKFPEITDQKRKLSSSLTISPETDIAVYARLEQVRSAYTVHDFIEDYQSTHPTGALAPEELRELRLTFLIPDTMPIQNFPRDTIYGYLYKLAVEYPNRIQKHLEVLRKRKDDPWRPIHIASQLYSKKTALALGTDLQSAYREHFSGVTPFVYYDGEQFSLTPKPLQTNSDPLLSGELITREAFPILHRPITLRTPRSQFSY